MNITDLETEDQTWVKLWLGYASGKWGTDEKGKPHPPGDLRYRLDLMRKYRATAFNYLVQTDNRAADIARHAGWMTGMETRMETEWDEPDAILRRVNENRDNSAALRLLGAIVARWAPQHLGMIPPDTLVRIAQDSHLPALVELHRVNTAEPRATNRDRTQQLDELTGLPIRASYLPPELLDKINPLPNGRRRAA